jgi:hypothetical protein
VWPPSGLTIGNPLNVDISTSTHVEINVVVVATAVLVAYWLVDDRRSCLFLLANNDVFVESTATSIPKRTILSILPSTIIAPMRHTAAHHVVATAEAQSVSDSIRPGFLIANHVRDIAVDDADDHLHLPY